MEKITYYYTCNPDLYSSYGETLKILRIELYWTRYMNKNYLPMLSKTGSLSLNNVNPVSSK